MTRPGRGDGSKKTRSLRNRPEQNGNLNSVFEHSARNGPKKVALHDTNKNGRRGFARPRRPGDIATMDFNSWAAWANRKPRPHHSEPGTLAQQLAASEIYAEDPDPDRRAAWLRARAVVMGHAAPAYLEYRGEREDATT